MMVWREGRGFGGGMEKGNSQRKNQIEKFEMWD